MGWVNMWESGGKGTFAETTCPASVSLTMKNKISGTSKCKKACDFLPFLSHDGAGTWQLAAWVPSTVMWGIGDGLIYIVPSNSVCE